ncbi:hypothetical protein DEO72_LG11g1805 [Vigna unguiculata]|uniref:Uncharacterized protein n=1 Tax=Vigna unguiculata TaxID=3917 RepID=A0A4D6NQK4_VIGUN|nr:hypothetical protein DEO72_LG11g1805 [Vigna unguiculata]
MKLGSRFSLRRGAQVLSDKVPRSGERYSPKRELRWWITCDGMSGEVHTRLLSCGDTSEVGSYVPCSQLRDAACGEGIENPSRKGTSLGEKGELRIVSKTAILIWERKEEVLGTTKPTLSNH